MPKSNIRPPRTPPRESPKVTIANQAKNIRLLISRCETLENQMRASNRRVDEVAEERDAAREQLYSMMGTCSHWQTKLEQLTTDLAHLRGYQERVREEDKHRYGDLHGAST